MVVAKSGCGSDDQDWMAESLNFGFEIVLIASVGGTDWLHQSLVAQVEQGHCQLRPAA